MKSYIPVTFLFLALGFYQMSGGSSFKPETSADTNVEARADAPGLLPAPAEVVTRAETEPTLAALTDLPVIAPVQDTSAIAQSVAPAAPADVPETAPDVRAVNGDIVNMRDGPGTNFGVVEKLTRGTSVEVVEIGADGWVKLRVTETGLEGWMAARLLTDAST